MEWAQQTDLQDLNFMVPDDPAVQNLLQLFMEKERIDISVTGCTDLDECFFRLQEDLMQSGLQDVDIMDKFCAPSVQIPLRIPPHLKSKPVFSSNVQNAEENKH